MTNTVTGKAKAAIGAATLGAMLMASAPASAQRWDRDHDRDGIGAGEIIAGAVVLGGLAAILSSGSRDRYDRHDDRRYYDDPRYGYGYDYRSRGNSRQAVNACVNTVERSGSRYGRADVTEIRRIDRQRDGYVFRGRVVVRDGWRGNWGRDGYYDRGRFVCEVRYGRVADVRFSGLG